MKVALVCIAKNEDNYIQEWIDYNKKLGFDNIFIYQNNWRWNGDSENVIKIEYDGLMKQREVYNSFIINNKNNYDWVAFFDVDEFLVLKKHNNIKEFIFDYNNFSAIGINWVLFGDNSLDSIDGDYSVIKRFTKRQVGVDEHVKSIVKLNQNFIMDVHNPVGISVTDTNKRIFSGPFNKLGDDNIAQLNHYFCKTKDEFKEKCERGRADAPNETHRRTMVNFDEYNFNEMEDLTAYKFIYNGGF